MAWFGQELGGEGNEKTLGPMLWQEHKGNILAVCLYMEWDNLDQSPGSVMPAGLQWAIHIRAPFLSYLFEKEAQHGNQSRFTKHWWKLVQS